MLAGRGVVVADPDGSGRTRRHRSCEMGSQIDFEGPLAHRAISDPDIATNRQGEAVAVVRKPDEPRDLGREVRAGGGSSPPGRSSQAEHPSLAPRLTATGKGRARTQRLSLVQTYAYVGAGTAGVGELPARPEPSGARWRQLDGRTYPAGELSERFRIRRFGWVVPEADPLFSWRQQS